MINCINQCLHEMHLIPMHIKLILQCEMQIDLVDRLSDVFQIYIYNYSYA